MKKSNVRIIALFIALYFIAGLGAAIAQETTKTLTKTLPQSQEISVLALGDNVEIIETLEDFSHIEVEVKVNASENITNKLVQSGAFSVAYNQNDTTNSLEVSAVKNEFYITCQGRDLEIKRSFKLYVPRGTVVKQKDVTQ